ncbi:MAG: hypothetical protein JW729_01995 [Bacteroidales bacterium]|nr:hypothetical protein [Bacteroidales bacterium]
MRKYLTQHSNRNLSIQIPSYLLSTEQKDGINSLPDVADEHVGVLNRFHRFILKHKQNIKEIETPFIFLNQLFKVTFEDEKNGWMSFDLNVDVFDNKSIWLQVKHSVFNQFNSLIGFSEVLKEVEELDDTDRILIDRINLNARNMYQTMKMLMEYEMLLHQNDKINANRIPAADYFESYFRHNQRLVKDIQLRKTPPSSVEFSIDGEYFKASLAVFFSLIQEAFDLNGSEFRIIPGLNASFQFEHKNFKQFDEEFYYQANAVANFFENGQQIDHFTLLSFQFFYIRLIAERMGGEFDISLSKEDGNHFRAVWCFKGIQTENDQVSLSIGDEELQESWNSSKESYPANRLSKELRIEIEKLSSSIRGTYVLDDWKNFASALQNLKLEKPIPDQNMLDVLIKEIEMAVKTFDIKKLQKLSTMLLQISVSE